MQFYIKQFIEESWSWAVPNHITNIFLSFRFPLSHKDNDSDLTVVDPVCQVHRYVEPEHTQHMPDTLDFYQITCTPTVSPVPLQLELWHRKSRSAGAKHIPGTSTRCFRSALIAVCSCCPFQTFFLSLTSYELECLEKHWSNMQSFTLVMSCPDTGNFISGNRIVSRIILALTVVSDDPWRRNMVWSLYHWLVHIIDSGLHFSAGSYQRNSWN